jgi:hypothetical protein
MGKTEGRWEPLAEFGSRTRASDIVTTRHTIITAQAAVVLTLTLVVVAGCRPGQPSTTSDNEAGDEQLGLQFRALVEEGKPDAFDRYYKEVVTKDTGFETETKPTLTELLGFFGYASLTAERLESAEPADVMAEYGSVLVTRFFAPKIISVLKPVPKEFGWRKLVRLRAVPMSRADRAGLHSMFLLFNVFTEETLKSPFGGGSDPVKHSVNNQVILVRKANTATLRPAYFMTFGAFDSDTPDERGRLINYMNATFDAANVPAGGTLPPGVKPYYVPVACEACHGGENRPKLNYLDTDHWLDRVGDDFAKVRQPVIFDGGTNDPGVFKQAFAVIRALNDEILSQNKDSDGTMVSFQQAAARSWVEWHETNDGHRPLHSRTIASNRASTTWSENDAELLGLLNRYCFRCHSTIRYHVFDKAAVLDRRARMISRIMSTGPDVMPQDRKLTENVKDRLQQILAAMQP